MTPEQIIDRAVADTGDVDSIGRRVIAALESAGWQVVPRNHNFGVETR